MAVEKVPAQKPRSVLILSSLAFTLLFAVWLMLGVLGVPIQAELGLSRVEFAWLGAIAIFTGSVLRLPCGLLTDRFGGRSLMTAVLLFTALPCYAVSWATSFAELLLCAALFGVAGNSFSIGVAWNAAWFERHRQGFALGVFGAGNVGAALTKLLGPALIALVPAAGFLDGVIPGGWRFVPVLYSALLVAMAGVVWVFSPVPDRRPSAGRALPLLVAPLREVRVWRFGLYYVVVFGAYVALSLWLPNYYVTVYGFSLAEAALLTALFIFPASLLRPLGGWLSDRVGARAVTYAVFAIMLFASVPLAALGLGPWSFLSFILVLGVGMGIGKGSVYKYIPEYFPRDVGLVGGLVGTLGALGGFLLPLGFGYVEQQTGEPQSCFWLMLALIVVSLGWLHFVVLGIKRRAARESAVTPPSSFPAHR